MEHERERSVSERLDGLQATMEEKLEGISDAIRTLAETMNQRFETVDRRFEAVDRRFEAVDQRLEAVDQRLDGMVQRFDGIDTQLHKLEILATDSMQLAKNLTDSSNATRDNMERGFKEAAEENRKEFALVKDAIRYWGQKVTGLEQREQRP